MNHLPHFLESVAHIGRTTGQSVRKICLHHGKCKESLQWKNVGDTFSYTNKLIVRSEPNNVIVFTYNFFLGVHSSRISVDPGTGFEEVFYKTWQDENEEKEWLNLYDDASCADQIDAIILSILIRGFVNTFSSRLASLFGKPPLVTLS